MFRMGEPDPWSWETTDSGPVKFLVWALLDDGLRVGRFDAHAEGNGRLRAAGMDAAGWRAWLEAVVAAHVAARQAAVEAHQLSPETIAELRESALDPDRARRAWRRRAFRRVLSRNSWSAGKAAARRAWYPVALWPGRPEVKRALKECFRRWQHEQRGDPGLLGPPEPADLERYAARQHELYAEFRAMSPRPSTLSVHVVRYPVAVVEPVPPVTLVIGRPQALVHEVYEDLLRRGVRELVGAR